MCVSSTGSKCVTHPGRVVLGKGNSLSEQETGSSSSLTLDVAVRFHPAGEG